MEVYWHARQQSIDGTGVPSFTKSVHIPPVYQSNHCLAQSASIKGVSGMLIQYLSGFARNALSTIFDLRQFHEHTGSTSSTIIREEDTSDWEWRGRQAIEAEESSIGQHMQLFVKREKGFDYEYQKSR